MIVEHEGPLQDKADPDQMLGKLFIALQHPQQNRKQNVQLRTDEHKVQMIKGFAIENHFEKIGNRSMLKKLLPRFAEGVIHLNDIIKSGEYKIGR